EPDVAGDDGVPQAGRFDESDNAKVPGAMPADQPSYRLNLASTELTPGSVSGGGGLLAQATSVAAGALGLGGGGGSAPALLSLCTDADLATPAASLDVWFGTPAGVTVAPGDSGRLALGYGTSFTGV